MSDSYLELNIVDRCRTPTEAQPSRLRRTCYSSTVVHVIYAGNLGLTRYDVRFLKSRHKLQFMRNSGRCLCETKFPYHPRAPFGGVGCGEGWPMNRPLLDPLTELQRILLCVVSRHQDLAAPHSKVRHSSNNSMSRYESVAYRYSVRHDNDGVFTSISSHPVAPTVQ